MLKFNNSFFRPLLRWFPLRNLPWSFLQVTMKFSSWSLPWKTTWRSILTWGASTYSWRRSIATMLVSTSDVHLTNMLSAMVICKAYDTDKPTRPGFNVSRPSTANRAAKKITEFPVVSSRTWSHLQNQLYTCNWRSSVRDQCTLQFTTTYRLATTEGKYEVWLWSHLASESKIKRSWSP